MTKEFDEDYEKRTGKKPKKIRRKGFVRKNPPDATHDIETGKKLTRRKPNNAKQNALLNALALNPSIASAARSVGIPESTVYNWMKEPEFKEQVREAEHRFPDMVFGMVFERAKKNDTILWKLAEKIVPVLKDRGMMPGAGGSEKGGIQVNVHVGTKDPVSVEDTIITVDAERNDEPDS